MRWLRKEIALLLPIALCSVCVFYVLPILQIAWGSLHGNAEVGSLPAWVGLRSYEAAGSSTYLLNSAIAAVAFAVTSAFAQVSLAFLAALLLRRQFPAVGFARWLLVIPYFVPTVVVVITWRFFSDPEVGLLQVFLRHAGIRGVDFRGPGAAFFVMILVASYEAIPFSFVVLLGRLLQIPETLYEFAELSCPSPWLVFRTVTWPQVRGTLLILLAFRAIVTALKFDVPWLVYASQASSRWADTLPVAIYRWAFEYIQFGRAYAASMIGIFILALLASLWHLSSRVLREKSHEAR